MARVIKVGEDAYGNGEFAPIPVGTKLKVAVYDIEESVTGPNSQKPGTPQFMFTAKVTDDFQWVDPEKGPQNAKGREIRYNYITLDPDAKGAWALVAFANAVGWPTKDGVELPDNLKDVLGTEFVAKIGQTQSQKTDPNTGKPYMNNRVTGYAKIKSGGGGGVTETTTPSWSEL
jgi:hypothetical protein